MNMDPRVTVVMTLQTSSTNMQALNAITACKLYMYFFQKVFMPFTSSEILIMTGISMLILVCVYQTNTVVTEFVSVIYAGTQTRKSSSTSSDITFILENLERWKPYNSCFALLVFVTFSHVSRPHMFWMVVTGLGSRTGRVLCGVQLLFTCFSSVLGHLGNCSGKFHYIFLSFNSHRFIVRLLYELTVHSKHGCLSILINLPCSLNFRRWSSLRQVA